MVEEYLDAMVEDHDFRDLVEMNGRSCGGRQIKILWGYRAWSSWTNNLRRPQKGQPQPAPSVATARKENS